MAGKKIKARAGYSELPSPASRPQADVVIYDGACRMCTAQVSRLARWDTGQRLAYLSQHDPEVARRYPDLTAERLNTEMVVVDRRGRRHGGADAVGYLTRRLPWLYWLAPAVNFPGAMPVWRQLYRVVASTRYLFGRVPTCTDDACQVHLAGRTGRAR